MYKHILYYTVHCNITLLTNNYAHIISENFQSVTQLVPYLIGILIVRIVICDLFVGEGSTVIIMKVSHTI